MLRLRRIERTIAIVTGVFLFPDPCTSLSIRKSIRAMTFMNMHAVIIIIIIITTITEWQLEFNSEQDLKGYYIALRN